MKKSETEFNFLNIYSKKKTLPFYQKCSCFLSTIIGTVFFISVLGLSHYLNEENENQSETFIFNPHNYSFSYNSHLSDEDTSFIYESFRKKYIYNEK